MSGIDKISYILKYKSDFGLDQVCRHNDEKYALDIEDYFHWEEYKNSEYPLSISFASIEKALEWADKNGVVIKNREEADSDYLRVYHYVQKCYCLSQLIYGRLPDAIQISEDAYNIFVSRELRVSEPETLTFEILKYPNKPKNGIVIGFAAPTVGFRIGDNIVRVSGEGVNIGSFIPKVKEVDRVIVIKPGDWPNIKTE